MKLRHDLAALLPRLGDEDLAKFCAFYERYAPHFGVIGPRLYDRLSAADQPRFLTWFLKRWARIDLVNPVERALYQGTVQRTRQEARDDVPLDGKVYKLRDFKSQGYDFQLLGYDWVLGVHDVLYNQYEHGEVTLKPDDVVIDAGAFIGDTAVFFHHKLQGRCQVHSFELVDENLALLVHNIERNGVADDQIVINKLALSDKTGETITIATGGTQSACSIFGKNSGGEQVETVTLDDYVMLSQLPRVDFIKMDIEGAEAMALAGARQTIAHFKPRLAICLYHKWDDVITIPKAIDATGVDYDFRFKWVQLTDGWEAVLLATPAAPGSARPASSPASTAGDDALAVAMAVLTKACLKRAAPALRTAAQAA